MSAGMKMAKAGYRGDPGLFGFLGKAIGAVAGVVPGGGLVKTALKVGGALLGGKKVASPIGSAIRRTPGIVGALGPIATAATIPPILKGAGGVVARGVGAAVTGYGVAKGVEAVAGFFKGGRKKYRRMNATNPKALKRAIRRVVRFGEVARSCGYSKPPAVVRGCKGPPRRRKTCR